MIGAMTDTRTAPTLLDAPARAMLMIDGTGPAGTPAFLQAVGALSAALGADAPLEGLWSSHGGGEFDLESPDAWEWTLMVPAPEAGAPAPPAPLRRELLDEGRVAEILHLGPYEAEAPTIAALHAFIAEQGLHPRGRHHEIYLDDPRTTEPERLRTRLRRPVA